MSAKQKIAIFSKYEPGKIENRVNAFLEHIGDKLVDVKFTESLTVVDSDWSIMVVYRDG